MLEDPPAGALGPAYEIGPSGTQFATPVVLVITYTYGELSVCGCDAECYPAAYEAAGMTPLLVSPPHCPCEGLAKPDLSVILSL